MSIIVKGTEVFHCKFAEGLHCQVRAYWVLYYVLCIGLKNLYIHVAYSDVEMILDATQFGSELCDINRAQAMPYLIRRYQS